MMDSIQIVEQATNRMAVIDLESKLLQNNIIYQPNNNINVPNNNFAAPNSNINVPNYNINTNSINSVDDKPIPLNQVNSDNENKGV